MNYKLLTTDSYKGVRDFYPEDMAIQRYIFDTWSYTAESFGYERYDASVLEPSELYKNKGAENEEMVNEANNVMLQISITTQLRAPFIEVVRNKGFMYPVTKP